MTEICGAGQHSRHGSPSGELTEPNPERPLVLVLGRKLAEQCEYPWHKRAVHMKQCCYKLGFIYSATLVEKLLWTLRLNLSSTDVT